MSNTKYCARCKKYYPPTLSYFYRNSSAVDGLSFYCRQCQKDTVAKYRGANSEKARAASRRWHNSNLDYAHRRGKEYREKNSEREKERLATWRKENPQKVARHNQVRRTRKEKLPSDFTETDKEYCFSFWENICCYCRENKATCLDHFIPVKHGGGTTPGNIVPACKSCNASKGHFDPMRWLIRKYGRDHGGAIYKKIIAYFKTVRRTD